MQACAQQLRAYATVAEAIRFVLGHVREQPSLEQIAGRVGLSPQHLQRVFSDWAGISPKRFLQYLTKESAKQLLRHSHSVLASALDAGLSGPGRLHDLMVACDAMTPGEVGAWGRGLEITAGFAASPWGRVVAGLTARGVCHLGFVEPGGEFEALGALHTEWPEAHLVRDDSAVAALAARLFVRAPERSTPLRVLLRGTNFQIKVWEALLRVPLGEVVSYGDLAVMAARPRAPRAVGSALARNRVAVLVPCHRVIRESGALGEYRWGAIRKAALLAWEQGARG